MNKQRKTSHILNVFQYDADGHVVLPASLTLSIAPAAGDNNSKVPTTAWTRSYVSSLSYLTGNQTITVNGDASGSGTTSINLTLANTAVTPGVYGSTTLVPVITVDSKGRITNVTTAAISGSLTFTGDVTGTGTTGTSTALTLANSGVTIGTYTKVTVDSKGRVTVGANATTSDISEGTRLYYTDARVLAYLGANNYATQSYVGTQIANLVASSPATLDTLNELAAALGNDPSFATTTATSLGNRLRVDTAAQGLNTTQQSNGRTNLGLGTAATSNTGDFVAYRTFGTAANNNTGDFAAASHTHSIANVTGLQTALDGKQASGSYAASVHSHIISDVTGLQTALDGKQASLGFTPYNATNPSGYITSSATSLSLTGNLTVSSGNTTGGGIILADDGDIVDLNDAYLSLRFSSGVRIYSANRSGSAVITLGSNGIVTATTFSGNLTGNASGTAGSISGFNNPTAAATANTIAYRDGSGDLYARYFLGGYVNTSDNVDTGTITYIMAKFGDNYHRSATAVKVQAFLGLGSAAYQNTGAFLSSSGSVTVGGYLTVNGAGTSSSIYMNDSDEGNREIHCNSNRIGFLTQAGAWGAYCDDAGNWYANNLSGTNTGDQTNISGNAATANGANGQFYIDDNYGNSIIGLYSASRYQGVFSMGSAYVLPVDGTGPGNLYGLAWSHPNAGGQAGYLNDHGLLVMVNGLTYAAISSNIWARGNITANGQFSGDGTGLTGTASALSIGGSAGTLGGYAESSFWRDNQNRTIGVLNFTGVGTDSGNVNQSYAIYQEGGAWSPPFPDLCIGYHTGIKLGAYFGYNGIRFFNNSDFATQTFSVNDGDNHVRVAYNLYVGGSISGSNLSGTNTGDQTNISGNAGTATTANTLVGNATISGLNFGGVLALTGSGASTGNSTGARLSESYGPIWNLSNSSTWHHQVINGSYLCGISAGGGNYGGGNYYGSGDVTAYYSDERLKTKVSIITDAIEKIKSLEGFVYIENDLAKSFGYTNEKEQAGVSAQQIQAVLPQAVSLAPFDMQGVPETGEIISKSGDNYLTVKYDRIVPLLIEGIKEQQKQIEELKNKLDSLIQN